MATRLDGKMILWTITLVVLVGLICSLTLLSPPPGHRIESVEQSSEREQPLVVVVPQGRDPASVNTAVQLAPISLGGKENLHAVDLTIPCDGVQKTVFTQRVKQLRIKGNSCLNDAKKLKRSDIQNAANGYSATVFFPSQTTFTTDYISLENGLNRIVIKHQYANGTVEEREYVVEREL